MSIIFGVVQMSVGIVLSLFNAMHFRKPLDIWCEFVPQMIFLQAIFGWLVFLILFKWCHYYEDPSQAPFILNALIKMFLSPGVVDDTNRFFDGQLGLQWFLIFLAFVSVPWMLVAKPMILRQRHNESLLANPHHGDDEEESNGHGGDDHGHGGEFDFGEIFIHQIIHTIEFVLGCVSNTASYLRLWALSLAHSQLSEVFWARLFMLTFGIGNDTANRGASVVAIFIGWSIWAGVTMGVLMVMESLSSFLHALRLHWVEFQNKFFKGDGKAFTPFSYEKLLSPDEM